MTGPLAGPVEGGEGFFEPTAAFFNFSISECNCCANSLRLVAMD
jgi:hypothetical protein